MSFDITESRALVIEYLEKVQSDINIQNVKRKTSKGYSAGNDIQMSIEKSPTGGKLLGPFWITFLEDGRGPTSPTGPYQAGPKLIDIIKKWIKRQGLDLNPYAITKTIHQKGTMLYREGGKSGVLSIPLAPAGINELFKNIAGQINKDVFSEVYQPLNEFVAT